MSEVLDQIRTRFFRGSRESACRLTLVDPALHRTGWMPPPYLKFPRHLYQAHGAKLALNLGIAGKDQPLNTKICSIAIERGWKNMAPVCFIYHLSSYSTGLSTCDWYTSSTRSTVSISRIGLSVLIFKIRGKRSAKPLA